MAAIIVTVPASLTHLLPGPPNVGLSLGLYTTARLISVEVGLKVRDSSEHSAAFGTSRRHPFVASAVALCRELGCVPSGLEVDIESQIPLELGATAHDAAILAGLVATNVLLHSPLSRQELLNLGGHMVEAQSTLAASMWGGIGLTGDDYADGPLPFTSVAISKPAKVGLIALGNHQSDSRVVTELPFDDHFISEIIGRNLLFVEAIRSGDNDLLKNLMRANRHRGGYPAQLRPGLREIFRILDEAEASYLYLPRCAAVLLFAAEQHEKTLETAAEAYMLTTGGSPRTWLLPIDRFGISISEMSHGMEMGTSKTFRPKPASPYPAH